MFNSRNDALSVLRQRIQTKAYARTDPPQHERHPYKEVPWDNPANVGAVVQTLVTAIASLESEPGPREACTDFAGKHLEGTDFAEAHLEGANFADALLREVCFRGARLKGAILKGAQLFNVDFHDAKDLTQQQLDSAHGNAGTRLPAHLSYPRHWAV